MAYEAFSAAERKKKLDEAEKRAVGTKPKAKAKAKPKAKVKPLKVDPKHAADRKAKIKAAREADLRAIAARRAKRK